MAVKETRGRRFLRACKVSYIVALHALVIFLVVKTNFILLAAKTLGLLPPDERSEDLYRATLYALAHDESAPSPSVLILGDSMVAPMDASLVAEDALNLGVGGTTTRTLIEWLPAVGALSDAETVVLLVGCNDLKYQNAGKVRSDYQTVLEELRARGAERVLCLSLLPIDERTAAPPGRSFIDNGEIQHLNDVIEEITDLPVNSDWTFVDLHPAFCDETGQLSPSLHGGDGWHLSEAGLERLAGEIRSALSGASPPRPPGQPR